MVKRTALFFCPMGEKLNGLIGHRPFILLLLAGGGFFLLNAFGGGRDEGLEPSYKSTPFSAQHWAKGSSEPINREEEVPSRDRRGGPDRFGYRWVDSDEQGGGVRYEWVDVRNLQGVQQLQGGDDINLGPYELGFNFPWYGQNYDRIRLCSNGWITFNPDERAVTISLPQCPNAGPPNNILAILNYDLNPGAGGAWYFWTNRRDRAIVSWVNVPRFNNANIVATFQVILNSNGVIYYQYQSLQNLNHGEVNIGWENPDGQDGHSISYHQEFAHNELAVRIAKPMGSIRGRVVDLATNDPIAGASVQVLGGVTVQTNEEGRYFIGDLLAGRYVLEAWARFYNRVRSDTLAVADRETLTVNFSLPHPEIRVEAERFDVEVPRDGVDRRSFPIYNEGNGPLSFSTKFSIPVRDDPGDVIFEWNATQITGDRGLRGLATDGHRVFLTGSNNNDNPNYIYILERGEQVARFAQPHENQSAIGLKGLAFDGTYLYSADGRIINKIDLEGNLVGTINSPVNPTRYIAYDPDHDWLWVCEITSNVVAIDRQGNAIRQFNKPQRAYGLAWHPGDLDGFNLYIFHRIPEGSQLALAKMNPENGQIRDVLEFSFQDGDNAQDCDITNRYNPLIWLFTALVDNPGGDRVVAAELELNTSWVQVIPRSGTVPPGDSLTVNLRFDALGWEPGRYELELIIQHNARGGDIHIPLSLTVTEEVLEPEFYSFTPTDIHHTITITDVDLRGEPAEFGDEIGVFTPAGVCAGGSLWFDRVTPLTAYGDDPETEEMEGFREDEAFAFRVWDRSINRDFPADFTYRDGDRRFRPGGLTRGSLQVAGLVRSMVWDLTTGWHLISINMTPDTDEISELMSHLVRNGTLLMVKDGQGRFYLPRTGFNNIPRWNPVEGYWVKLGRADRLEISGESLEPGTPIDLRQGWNLVSYIPRQPMAVEQAFSPLEESLIIVKDGRGRFYFPAHQYSNIPICREGEGYAVKVRDAVRFRYPLAGVVAVPQRVEDPQWVPVIEPTGVNMSLLVEVPWAQSGWEVAVVSPEGLVVGSGVIDGKGRAGIAIWGDDPMTSFKEGLREGDAFTLDIFDAPNHKITARLTLIEGSARFQADGWAYGRLERVGDMVPEDFYLGPLFPNPFNLGAQVEVGIPRKSELRLSICDLTGREVGIVFQGVLTPGVHNLPVDGKELATGCYFMVMQGAGVPLKAERVVVMK